jgi:hypothetical protein
MRIYLVLVAAVAIGCKKPAPPQPPVEVASSPEAAPTKLEKRFTVHLAQFDGGRLLLCRDVTVDVEAPLGTELQDPFGNAPKAGNVKVAKPCEESFRDRKELARCESPTEHSEDAGITERLRLTTRYYDFGAALADDSEMQTCLQMKGQWTAIQRGTPEWRAASRAHALRDLQKRADEYQKIADSVGAE